MDEPWAKAREEVLRGLGSNSEMGLSTDEVQERLKRYGLNKLARERRVTFLGVFREEVTEPMILLLLAVGLIYAIWGELRDVITIFAVITAIIFVEIFTEYRATNAVAALRKLSPPTTPVIRGGSYRTVPAEQVVSGDVIPLGAGDRVPADGRVLGSFGLQLDESSLTGESVPVDKEDVLLPPDTSVAERRSMVFAGTAVTAGRGSAIITATGMDTELGKVTGLVLEAREPRTPLQSAMRELSGLLVWVAVFFSILIPAIGFFQNKDYKEMILTGLSLSFATIPEELPIIITMVLGVGALTLSRRNVLIRRLRAAETLGEVTTIVTDKTGTITQNRMSVVRLATGKSPVDFPARNLSLADVRLLKVGVFTSTVKRAPDGSYTGDPLEVALLEAARADGMSPEQLKSQYRVVREFSFDNRRKMMSVVCEESGGLTVYAKGAPEVILAKSYRIAQDAGEREKMGADTELILRQADDMAKDAMRVVALATRTVRGERISQDEAENGLTFLGLIGMTDPPRDGVSEAIRATRDAGIRTIMVSGDFPLTVQKVASAVGIGASRLVTGRELSLMDDATLRTTLKEVSLFARTSPEQKLSIVRALQGEGEVVAVTGDGINDAPALRAADIGIAMGKKGTEAAREAASMVLTDDSFNSIVDGVREGRKIFDNLKKGVTYYLSVKIALVLSFVVPLALGIPFPFAPIQIVLLELFMDLAASATYVAEPMEPNAMHRPPRPKSQRFFDRGTLIHMALSSVALAGAVLINYLVSFYVWQDLLLSRTMAFGTWLIGHIFLAFSMRSIKEPVWSIGVFKNRFMLLWALVASLFLVAVTFIPFAGQVVKVTTLNLRGWFYIIGVPLVTVFWLEVKKELTRR